MIEFLFIVVTILLSAFFSGSEIAFVTANKLKLEVASRKNSFLGNSIEFFTRKPETFLTTAICMQHLFSRFITTGKFGIQ